MNSEKFIRYYDKDIPTRTHAIKTKPDRFCFYFYGKDPCSQGCGAYIAKKEGYFSKSFWLEDNDIPYFEKALKDAQYAFKYINGYIKDKKGMRKIHNIDGVFQAFAMLKIFGGYMAEIHNPRNGLFLHLEEYDIRDLLRAVDEAKAAYKEYWGHDIWKI